jgi:hypothetical protein
MGAEFVEGDCADLKIASLSNRKLVIYPFISAQKTLVIQI